MKIRNAILLFVPLLSNLTGLACYAATALDEKAEITKNLTKVIVKDAYRHPLLMYTSQESIDQYFHQHPQASGEDFLHDHMEVTGVSVAEEGGPEESLTGIVPIDREPIPGHLPSSEPEQPKLSIGAFVQRWLDDVDNRPSGIVKLSLGILPGWNPVVSVRHAQRVAMVEGKLLTHADASIVRAEVLQRRYQAGINALKPLRNAVLAMNGRVLDFSANAGTLQIELPISKLDKLLIHPELGRIELTQEEQADAGIAYNVDGDKIDGRELEDLLQTTQAYDRGYQGDSTEHIALVEGGGATVFNDHPGLADRYSNCFDLGIGTCTFFYPIIGNAHATAVASVLLGNVTDGQDSILTWLAANPDLMERERSGVARDALGRGFSGSSFSFLEDRLAFYDDTYILTQSASYLYDDPDCRGETTPSRNWNSLFESGYALFNSAGNDGHYNVHNCTVSSPATAIGVFSVGAYIIDDNDNEAIYPKSDRGGDGTKEQGRHRTVIDIIGPSKIEYSYPHYDWPVDINGDIYRYGTEWNTGSGNGPSSFCCTSSATPAVAGTAALFRQWFKDVYNDSIDNPGLLYTNLLLMGDRRKENRLLNQDFFLDTGFDSLWGAGKLRLRLFDATGMDAPMSWATGNVCIDDGYNTYIDIGSVSNDVDIINSVIWWYDRRHDDGTHHDNVNLDLEYDDGNGFIPVISSHTKDNKERVALQHPDGGTYRINLSGQHITADDEGCGTNSMLVYWAYIAEDGDREASENLPDVRPYPLDFELPPGLDSIHLPAKP